MMETRYLKSKELKKIAKREDISDDLINRESMGISPISDIFMFLENEKIHSENYQRLMDYIKKLKKYCDNGNIYISELNQENLSTIFLDELHFWNNFNLAKNPYDLIKLITLIKLNENVFWDENVYPNSI